MTQHTTHVLEYILKKIFHESNIGKSIFFGDFGKKKQTKKLRLGKNEIKRLIGTVIAINYFIRK